MNVTRFDFHFHDTLAQILLQFEGSYSSRRETHLPTLMGDHHSAAWGKILSYTAAQLELRGHLVGDLGPKTINRILQPAFTLTVDCTDCRYNSQGQVRVVIDFSWGPGDCLTRADVLNLEVLTNLPVSAFLQSLIDRAVTEREDFVGKHTFMGGRQFRRLASSRRPHAQIVAPTGENAEPHCGDRVTLVPGITIEQIRDRLEALQLRTAPPEEGEYQLTARDVTSGRLYPLTARPVNLAEETVAETLRNLSDAEYAQNRERIVAHSRQHREEATKALTFVPVYFCLDGKVLHAIRPNRTLLTVKEPLWPAEGVHTAAKQAATKELPPLIWSYLDIHPDTPLEPTPVVSERFDYLFDP